MNMVGVLWKGLHKIADQFSSNLWKCKPIQAFNEANEHI